MRLNPISFTHASTAMFGLAVAGYAALRLAGYDIPHDPAHQALATPSTVDRVPGPRQPATGAAPRSTAPAHVTRPTHPGDGQHTHVADATHRLAARRADEVITSPSPSRDAQDSFQGQPTQEGTAPAELDDATPSGSNDDSPDPTTSGATDDSPDDD